MFSKFINQNFGSGHVFELEIRNLLRAHGLSATTTGNDDRGVDIVAEADLGTRNVKFYIQCKYHNKAIGLEAIQEVYTGTSLRGNDGYPVVITNNRVTYEARKCAVKLGVEIIADREWQELQDGFEHYQVTDKTHYGLGKVGVPSTNFYEKHQKSSGRNNVVITHMVNTNAGSSNQHTFTRNGNLLVLSTLSISEAMPSSTNYLSLYRSNSEDECRSFISYINTRLIRFLILGSIVASSLRNTETWRFVPDPGAFDHIFTDQELYQKYGLTDDEIAIIESVIKERK